jgi:threonine/homoserine/homoserine lactone efflux protein
LIELSWLAPFLLGSVIVTVVPGADMALVTRQVLRGGRPLAHRTIVGNLAGLVVHGGACAAGLSAVVLASATAYDAVRLAGAAYLIFLGIQAFRDRGHLATAPADASAPPRRLDRLAGAATQGFVSTVLNPKPALFFLAFVPQFVDPGAGHVALQIAGLTAIHIVIGALWLTFYAALVDRAATTLTRPRVRMMLQRSMGVVLLALGLRVAFERRLD